jgi:TP901-1 family phage major tail protein
MPAASGRDLIIKRNGTKIASVTTKNFSVNNEPIDITTDDDSGFRTLLDVSGVRTIDASVEGVYIDDTLLSEAAGASPTLITADEIVLPSAATITGNFRLNNIDITGEVAGRVEFSATLQSSGAWVFTP